MIAVLFEVRPRAARRQDCFDVATRLRPGLDDVDCLVSVERFQSLSDPGKLLSLSFFRDEASIATWRERSDHRRAQTQGRDTHFADERLCIARTLRDYGLHDRAEVPPGSRARHG